MGPLYLLIVLSLAIQARTPSPATEEPRWRGRIVADGTGAPVAGARISTFEYFRIEETAATTAIDGSFELAGPARRDVPPERWQVGLDRLRIDAPGFATTFVDAQASGPWVDAVRLRPATTLRVTLKGAGRGARATARFDTALLSWPPQTGLTSWLPPIEARYDEAGFFELPSLPTRIPIDLEFDSGWDERRSGVLLALVLQPGEARTLELDFATLAPIPSSTALVGTGDGWKTVTPIALDAREATRQWSWFEFLDGGRHPLHTGSSCGHDNRVCSHHEARPGACTFVARDPAGWIGVRTFTVAETDRDMKPTITLAPGALLRIDASALTSKARVELSTDGTLFAVREMRPGVVQYELAPAGAVAARVLVDGKVVVTRSVATKAGEIVELQL